MASNLYQPVIVSDSTDLPFKWFGALAGSCFVGALVADIVYAGNPDFMWVTFSVWMITIGLIVAFIATVIGLIDRLRRHRFGAVFTYWPYLLGFAAVVVVSIFNAFVHSRDAYQAVVPEGIVLSAVAVLILVLTPVFARAFSQSRNRKVSP